MKTQKKQEAKSKGIVPGGANKTFVKPADLKPSKKLEDEDDEFDEPLEDVDFESLNNFEDDDY